MFFITKPYNMLEGHKMNIRKAENKDIRQILEMLSQVLEVHALVRPDIFIPNTTKYGEGDLQKMIEDENNYIYVAVDEKDTAIAYAFCELQIPKFSRTNVQHKYFYIDDFCVDEKHRKEYVGKRLFKYVIEEAKKLDCYEIVLACWEGNDVARKFYEKMGMKVRKTTMELIIK